MRVGLITIGQSPRVDVVPEIRDALPDDVEILEYGVLDGLSSQEIGELRPLDTAATLVTRLRDGTGALVDKGAIHARLSAVLGQADFEVDSVALLCSASFDELQSSRVLVLPSRLLRGYLSAVRVPGPVGVLVPSRDQIPPISAEFETWGVTASLVSLSPYEAGTSLETALRELMARGSRAVVLDCLGYGGEMKRRIRELCGLPVISVRSLLIHALSELVV